MKKRSLYAHTVPLDVPGVFRTLAAMPSSGTLGAVYKTAKGTLVGSYHKTERLVDYIHRTQQRMAQGITEILGYMWGEYNFATASQREYWARIAPAIYARVEQQYPFAPSDPYCPPKNGLLRSWQNVITAVKTMFGSGDPDLLRRVLNSKQFQAKLQKHIHRQAIILRHGKDCRIVLPEPGRSGKRGSLAKLIIPQTFKDDPPLVVPFVLTPHSRKLLAGLGRKKGSVIEVRLFFDLLDFLEAEKVAARYKAYNRAGWLVRWRRIGKCNMYLSARQARNLDFLRIGIHVVVKPPEGESGRPDPVSGPSENLPETKKETPVTTVSEASTWKGASGCFQSAPAEGAGGYEEGSRRVPDGQWSVGRSSRRPENPPRCLQDNTDTGAGQGEKTGPANFLEQPQPLLLAARLATRTRMARGLLLRRVRQWFGAGVYWALRAAYKLADSRIRQTLDLALRKAIMSSAHLRAVSPHSMEVGSGLKQRIQFEAYLLELASQVSCL